MSDVIDGRIRIKRGNVSNHSSEKPVAGLPILDTNTKELFISPNGNTTLENCGIKVKESKNVVGEGSIDNTISLGTHGKLSEIFEDNKITANQARKNGNGKSLDQVVKTIDVETTTTNNETFNPINIKYIDNTSKNITIKNVENAWKLNGKKDTSFVHTTSDETIKGVKTFEDGINTSVINLITNS